MASTPSRLTKIDSAKHLEEQLRKGAVWMGDPPGPGKFRCELKEWPAESRVSPATQLGRGLGSTRISGARYKTVPGVELA